jgi:hypothetical protein
MVNSIQSGHPWSFARSARAMSGKTRGDIAARGDPETDAFTLMAAC